MAEVIRRMYADYVTHWVWEYASAVHEETGHTLTDAERMVAFHAWLFVIHNISVTYDEMDAALY